MTVELFGRGSSASLFDLFHSSCFFPPPLLPRPLSRCFFHFGLIVLRSLLRCFDACFIRFGTMPDEDARNSTWWCRCQSVWIKWLVQATTWRSSMKLAGFGNSTGASSDAEILSSRSRLRTLPANRRHCHVEPMLHVGMRHDRLVIRVSRTMQVKSIKNPQPISNIGRMYWNARDGTEQWNATEERHRSRWWVKYSSAFVFFLF